MFFVSIRDDFLVFETCVLCRFNTSMGLLRGYGIYMERNICITCCLTFQSFNMGMSNLNI